MSDKRQYQRTEINRPVVYIGKDGRGCIESQGVAQALDISPQGMMVESADPIDSKIVHFRTSTDDGKSVAVDGVMIYTMPHSPGRYRTGIKFDGTAEQTSRFFAELISDPVG